MQWNKLINYTKSCIFIDTKARWVLADALVTVLKASLHFAGPPCVDFTPQGQRDGLWGKAFAITCIWVAQRVLLQELNIFHENVVGCEMSFIKVVLDEWYICVPCQLDCWHLGWPLHRERLITLFLHRSMLACLVIPWNRMADCCRRVCECKWVSFLVDESHPALECDYEWSCARRVSCAKEVNRKRLFQDCPGLIGLYNSSGRWSRALGKSELNFLGGYRVLAEQGKYHMFLLSQDPDKHECWSRAFQDCRLPTLISNAYLAWMEHPVPQHSRLLATFELLALTGYPALLQHVQAGVTTSFRVPCEGRTRAIACKQAGNTIHVNISGVALIYAVMLHAKKARVEPIASLTPFLAKFV